MKGRLAISFLVFGLIGFAFLSNGPGERLTVAACPTFHDFPYGPSIDLIKTASTAESIGLLERGEVDLAVSGRALRVGEPEPLFRVIGPGYDIIFAEEAFAWESEIPHIRFYTDLDPDEVKKDLGIVDLVAVSDIESYLDKGPVITRLEGRMKGEVVNIFREDGSRVRMSRMPRLYGFDQKKIDRFVTDL